MAKKTCKDCKQTKPISHFHWADTEKGYKKTYCDKCSTKRTKANRKKELFKLTDEVMRGQWDGTPQEGLSGYPIGQSGNMPSYAPASQHTKKEDHWDKWSRKYNEVLKNTFWGKLFLK